VSKKEADESDELVEGWESLPLDPKPISWVPVPPPENLPSESTSPIHRNRGEGAASRSKKSHPGKETGDEGGAGGLVEGWGKGKIKVDWRKIFRRRK
jgi:hypothetical protein